MKKVLEELRDDFYEKLKKSYEFSYGPAGNAVFSLSKNIQYVDDFVKRTTVRELSDDELTIIEHFYDPKKEISFNREFTKFMVGANERAASSTDNLSKRNDYLLEKLATLASRLALDKIRIEAMEAALRAAIPLRTD